MQKVIYLIDMNAFFISCEETRHPEIIGKPGAVAGDPKNRSGIILTSNYQARKYGVKTTMVLHEALKLCPSLILLPPDHDFYEKKSKEVMNIFSNYTPIVEQNSIDEAWLEMTGCQGIFGDPLKCAKKIQDQINKDLGLPCSIGISENKFLSKMASDMKKPLGITELWKKDIKEKLWTLPVKSMYGVGKQTDQKLQNIRIKTIGDIALSSKETLVKSLGKIGADIYQLAWGIDCSSVIPHLQNDMKSIGRSTTLEKDIINIDEAKIILMELSHEIGRSARKHNKKGSTIQISIKYSDFHTITRQKSITPTYLTKDIYSTGLELLHKNWDKNLSVRLLGISISGFNEDIESNQMSMFSLPEICNEENKSDKIYKLETTLDVIQAKYGTSIISPAILLKNKNKR